MTDIITQQANRLSEGRNFGERAASHQIAALIDQPDQYETHISKWARNERMFCEWQFAKYHPELVP